MQAINVALHTSKAHTAFFDGQLHRLQIGLGIPQLLLVLLEAQARGLLFKLEFGDALAQRV